MGFFRELFRKQVPYRLSPPRGSEIWKIDRDILHAYDLGTTTTLSSKSTKHNQIRGRVGTRGGNIEFFGADYSYNEPDLVDRGMEATYVEENKTTYLYGFKDNYLIALRRGRIVREGHVKGDLRNREKLKEFVLRVDR